MSCALLGQTFDIHGGGADLQFPHHENEIAQSEGASGQTLANYWLHNGFVRVDNEKMSKSLGNFFTIRDALAQYDGETIRFFVVRSHYRSELPYSDAHLNDARAALRRLYTALEGSGIKADTPMIAVDWNEAHAQRFKQAMDEDFGTPEAVAVLFELATEVNRTRSLALAQHLRALAGVLGLLQQVPQTYLQAGQGIDAASIAKLIAQRVQAKQDKNYVLADEIRKSLSAQGVVLKDSPQGTTWERV
jgi:cysteinyl-tRNA synthetase